MSVLKKDLFARIPEGHPEQVKKLLADEMKDFHKKIIVLDDDPTGVQTVNGIHVFRGVFFVAKYVLNVSEISPDNNKDGAYIHDDQRIENGSVMDIVKQVQQVFSMRY